MTDAELVIVMPADAARRAAVDEFVGRCVNYGFDFYYEPGDALPNRVPTGVEGVRAIVIDVTDEPANSGELRRYANAGARVYVMDAKRDPTEPNARQAWQVGHSHDMIAFDAGLTLDAPRRRQKTLARDDDALFDAMGERMLAVTETGWYDATRYIWEGLLDGYELTGDTRYLDRALTLIHKAMATANPLDNCDTIAPLLPMLRAAEITDDGSLTDFARKHADRYLDTTPRYRGCLVNFLWLPNHVRSEIVWQVCPVLAYLSRVTGEPRYLDETMEQVVQLEALLLDRETGLWHHGAGDAHRTPACWARHAAFVLLGLIHIAEAAPDTDPRRDGITRTIRRMSEALIGLQADDGFLHTIVGQPNTERESSGTAWLCAALYRAIRLGMLDESRAPAAQRAWEAVKTRIWRGGYPGHNTATSVSPSIGYYTKRQLSPTGWTHFAFRAACERRRTVTTHRVDAEAPGNG